MSLCVWRLEARHRLCFWHRTILARIVRVARVKKGLAAGFPLDWQVKMPLSVSGFVCSGTFSYASSTFVPSMHLVNRCASGQWNWHLWKPCCIEIFTCRWPSQRTTLCWFRQPRKVYDSYVSVIRRLVHFCTLSLWPAVCEPASEEFVQLTTGAAKLATRPQMELVTEKRSAIPIAVL